LVGLGDRPRGRNLFTGKGLKLLHILNNTAFTACLVPLALP
jgi:hypothetical protein